MKFITLPWDRLVPGGLACWVLFLAPILHAQPSFPENLCGVGPPPVWVKTLDRPAPSEDAGGFNAGSEYLLVDDQNHPTSDTFYTRRAIRFVSIRGVEDQSTLTWTLDPDYERLILHDLKLIRGDEILDLRNSVRFRYSTSAQDDDRNSYGNRVEARILVPGARVGDILDYAFTIRGSNPVGGDNYSNAFQLSWGIPVARLHYRVLYPEFAPPLVWKTYNQAGDPVQGTWSGHHEYVWSRTQTPVDRWEDNMPQDVQIQDWVEVSTWPSWEAVSRWGARLYPLDSPTPANLRPLLDEWRRLPSLEERILAAIRHVQDEYRYVSVIFGPHGYKPFPPDDIVRHRYGDCKDKSLLLCILLRDLGVPAVPVLVDTEDRIAVGRRLPSPRVFDHVIVRLWVDGTAYDVDPTLSLQGGTLQTLTTPAYGVGLPLIPEGAALARDVADRYDPGRVEMTESFFFDSWDGGADLRVETVYTGEEADAMRRHLAGRSLVDLGAGYREYYADTYGAISLEAPVRFTDDRDANRLVVTEKYWIEDLFKPDPDIGAHQEIRHFFSTFVLDTIPDPPRGIERKHPYALNPRHLQQTIILHLPDKSQFEPERLRIANPYASLAYEVSQDGWILRLYADYRIHKDRIPAAAYETAMDDFQKMREALSYGIIADVADPEPTVSDRPNPTPVEPPLETASQSIVAPRPNWVGISLALTFLLATHLGFGPLRRAPASASLRPPDPSGPTGIGGWFILVLFGFSAGLVVRSLEIGDFRIFFDATDWYALTDPGSPDYVPGFEKLVIFELLGNIFFLYLNVLFLIAVVHKRWYVPRLGILALIGYAIFDSLDTAFYLQLEIAGPEEAETYTVQSVRAWTTGIIWSLYFHRSRRVSNTFRSSAREVDSLDNR